MVPLIREVELSFFKVKFCDSHLRGPKFSPLMTGSPLKQAPVIQVTLYLEITFVPTEFKIDFSYTKIENLSKICPFPVLPKILMLVHFEKDFFVESNPTEAILSLFIMFSYF